MRVWVDGTDISFVLRLCLMRVSAGSWSPEPGHVLQIVSLLMYSWQQSMIWGDW